jgi:transposase-like protein
VYLYRAVDAHGRTIDFLLSPRRNAAVARRLFQKLLKQSHTINPRTITVDKNAAYPITTKAMKRDGDLWRFAKLRQMKFWNNIVEQDHRRIKRLVRPGLGFKSFTSASQTRSGYEAMAMIRKGQVDGVPPNDMSAQRDFIATLFDPIA